jgi:hypothetical protein
MFAHKEPEMPSPAVEIMSTGRGGSIYYREGGDTAVFDWEFAASPPPK